MEHNIIDDINAILQEVRDNFTTKSSREGKEIDFLQKELSLEGRNINAEKGPLNEALESLKESIYRLDRAGFDVDFKINVSLIMCERA